LIAKLTNSKAEKERKEGLTLKKPKLDNYLSASIMETEEMSGICGRLTYIHTDYYRQLKSRWDDEDDHLNSAAVSIFLHVFY
jgi:hypothetical protein